MTFIDNIANRLRQGTEVGDWCPEDDVTDLSHFLGQSLAARGVGRIDWEVILKGIDCVVVYEPGWKLRGSASQGHIGVLWHWTAGKPTVKRPNPSLNICINGDPSRKIPGPLIHLLIGFDGRLHVCASGRANHAGMIHQGVLAKIKAGEAPKGTAKQLGLPDTGGSGGQLVGIEIENDGSAGFTQAQIHTIMVLGARLPSAFGISTNAAWTWTHAHVTRRKVDITGRKWPL